MHPRDTIQIVFGRNGYPKYGSSYRSTYLSFIGKYDPFAVIVYFPYYTRARVILGVLLERAS